MRTKFRYNYFLPVAVILLVTCIFGICLFLGYKLPKVFAKMETPEFCSNCHSVQYEAWFSSGAHKMKKCVDCHLPNDSTVKHYLWKGVTGLQDMLYHYVGFKRGGIHTSRSAKRIVKDNCIRCHSEVVFFIANEKRNCWECHRGIRHKRGGAL